MMKRLVMFMMLIACCACNLLSPQQEKHSISGVISDTEGGQERLMTGISAVVHDEEGVQVFSGDVIPEGAVGGSYSIPGVPDGEYEITFQGEYYKPRSYDVSVAGDTKLDAELEPIRILVAGQEEVRFASRVSRQILSVGNAGSKSMNIVLKAHMPQDALADLKITAAGLRKVDGSWIGSIAAGASLDMEIDILRYSAESFEGSLEIYCTDPYKWERCEVSVFVETTERDMCANLKGTVRDADGNPLEGVAVWNNCLETFAYTDENGGYSFDALPYLSLISVTTYSEYHADQSTSEEYQVREFVMDFVLEPVSNHVTFDRKQIDFGGGKIVPGAETERIEVNAVSDDGGIVEFSVVRATRDIDMAIGCTPASGAFKETRKFTFTLDREKSDGLGEFGQYFIIKTMNAGSYVFPISYTNIE